MGRVTRFTCQECKQKKQEVPVLLKGSTGYGFLYEPPSSFKISDEKHRERYELVCAKRDKYSVYFGKVFNCFFTYCKGCAN